jgi:L-lactate dehydrogenase complex protein LldE
MPDGKASMGKTRKAMARTKRKPPHRRDRERKYRRAFPLCKRNFRYREQPGAYRLCRFSLVAGGGRLKDCTDSSLASPGPLRLLFHRSILILAASHRRRNKCIIPDGGADRCRLKLWSHRILWPGGRFFPTLFVRVRSANPFPVVKVTLFIPCFVDLMFPQVGISMVRILEKLGHSVECPGKVACCGQPGFNSGYWEEARAVGIQVIEELKSAEVVVIASGSCGAMMKVFYPDMFKDTPHHEAAKTLAAKCHEFSDFLVNVLGVTDLGARFPAKVTFHDGCHGLRELGNKQPPRALLAKVRDLQLVEMKEEVCCGFGGTFAAKFPMISTAMGEVKCASALETGAEYIVSNDSSCLMHIQGLADRQGLKLKTIHLAEVLIHS